MEKYIMKKPTADELFKEFEEKLLHYKNLNKIVCKEIKNSFTKYGDKISRAQAQALCNELICKYEDDAIVVAQKSGQNYKIVTDKNEIQELMSNEHYVIDVPHSKAKIFYIF
jgi:hypothetical protein